MTEHHRAGLDPFERVKRNQIILYGLCALVALVAVVALLYGTQADRRANTNGAHANAAAKALGTANASLANNGLTPVPTPSSAAAATATVTVTPTPGRNGLNGKGIVASALIGGHLELTYTDGVVEDVGQVVGPAGRSGSSGQSGAAGPSGPAGATGSPGTRGDAGRGITSTEITVAGHLVITYTDGTTVDLGEVVGSNGANGENGNNGQDGASGASGASGQPGSPPASFTFTVPGDFGTSTTYDCAPDGSAGPGDQPSYSCATEPTGEPS